MTEQRDIYLRLRPFLTPPDEICACPSDTPIKLTSNGGMGANPIHCLRCNLEVAPERVGLDAAEVDDVADWFTTAGAIDALELASGSYELWARKELLDPQSPPNVEGRRIAAMLSSKARCYLSLWEADNEDGFMPKTACPICSGELVQYHDGVFPQALCERDRIVVFGK